MTEPVIGAQRRHYFSTRDLVLMAILAALGGVLSTYVGYLGSLMNKLFGVPFGAGQFMAGLHIFWFIVARGLVPRMGSATLTAVLKGLVEMLTGSTHGVVIVVVSLIEGLLVDLVCAIKKRPGLGVYALAGGLASTSNVIIFQLIFFSGAPPTYIVLISAFAFVSGAVLGGYFGLGMLGLIRRARVLRLESAASDLHRGGVLHTAVAGLAALALTCGAVYYYTQVFEPFWGGPAARIEGRVADPYDYRATSMADKAVTVVAELKGQVTYRPPAEYTGVPVGEIIGKAGPEDGATTLRVVAGDGYEAEFPLASAMADDKLLLVNDAEKGLRIVAANYDGAYWVEMVTRLVVE